MTARTIGSLFSGIGGLELGLERAGVGRIAWQVENNAFCRAVLAEHWAEAERFEDVRNVGVHNLRPVDVICGGFPCQDVSGAGQGAGLAGARSGLWHEFSRIVCELAPRAVVVENVASGARRWLPFVRRDLHVLGYRTRAFALSAADVGAPHLRKRVFVVALGDTVRTGRPGTVNAGGASQRSVLAQSGGRDGEVESHVGGGVDGLPVRVGFPAPRGAEPYSWEPPRTVSDRVPGRRERVRALGNAVVPQCAEVIGRVLKEMLSP